MKNITDYFSSPIKDRNATTSDSTIETQNGYSLDPSLEPCSHHLRIPKSDKATVNPKNKKTVKKMRRKPSDPKVGSLSQSPSNSDLIDSLPLQEDMIVPSPKGTMVEKSPISKPPSIQILDETDETENDSAKQNAFQFMMDSRNKIIGINSGGKEVKEKNPEDPKPKKEKLRARKLMLNEWAEQKSTSKRKREVQLDEIIRHKLSKRARRLKTLLHAQADTEVPKKRNKNVLHIPSSSESDSDFELDITAEIKNKKPIKSTKLVSSLECQDPGRTLSTKNKSSICLPNPVNAETSPNNMLVSSKSKVTSQSILSSYGVKNSKGSNVKVHKSTSEKVATFPKIHQDVETIDLKDSKRILSRKKIEPVELQPSDDEVTSVIVDKNTETMSRTVKNGRKYEIENSIDGSFQETASSTVRRLRSWKIKMNLSEQKKESNEINETDQTEAIGSTIHILSESEDDFINKKSKSLKMASLFTKSTPKPKEDSKVIEARKQFLMSGMPPLLKNVIEKEKSPEKDFVLFPTVSHIQQKCSHTFWHLPIPKLALTKAPALDTNHPDSTFKNLTKCSVIQKLKIQMEVHKTDHIKLLLKIIKRDNPNHPVYKLYRTISGKLRKQSNGPEELKTTHKLGKGKKKPSKRDVEFAMWTDKYKPRCADDVIGNTEAVKNLKKWLVTWMNFSQEINSKKSRNEGSESEFETTDGDSRDSIAIPGNTLVLGGPCGSGKSTSVYAICSELSFNVIELNASSKRTGKRLLQKIQEATRSYQVRKGETRKHSFANVSGDRSDTTGNQTDKNMVLILIEDIDIVFEQDEGFISALTQLISISKRPIILTTTDYDSVFIQKFVGQYEYIAFSSPTSYFLSTWLQILCLVEGMYIDKSELGGLMDYNGGDLRKTLLELQFWVESGGQINRTEIPIQIEHKTGSCDEKLVEDEQINCLVVPAENNKVADVFMHKNCIRSFELFEFQKPFMIPLYLNLAMIWWNIPNILGLPDYSKQRVDKFNLGTAEEKLPTKKVTKIDKKKFKSVTVLYDLLSFTDVMFTKVDYFDSDEPLVRNQAFTLTNSLELGENYDLFDGNTGFVHELCHNLVNRFVKVYNRIHGDESKLKLSPPDKTERRWRAKQHRCEDIYQDAIVLSNHLERKSVSLDYVPALRNISRIELNRAANETKRGNRFRNYLRHLGMNRTSNLELACNVLKS